MKRIKAKEKAKSKAKAKAKTLDSCLRRNDGVEGGGLFHFVRNDSTMGAGLLRHFVPRNDTVLRSHA